MPNIQVKLRRGTTAQHAGFTGAEGEVTVDTDKDTVIVHDGSTAGGHELAKSSDVAAAYTHPNHTGDVTSTGDGATVIANDAVTNAKIADNAVTSAKVSSSDTVFNIQGTTGLYANNVGIGLNTPIAPLHIKRLNASGGMWLESNFNNIITFKDTAGATDQKIIQLIADGNELEIRQVADNAVDTETVFKITSDPYVEINISHVPTYADDTTAGAGGLTAGQIYKTSTGELRIKL